MIDRRSFLQRIASAAFGVVAAAYMPKFLFGDVPDFTRYEGFWGTGSIHKLVSQKSRIPAPLRMFGFFYGDDGRVLGASGFARLDDRRMTYDH